MGICASQPTGFDLTAKETGKLAEPLSDSDIVTMRRHIKDFVSGHYIVHIDQGPDALRHISAVVITPARTYIGHQSHGCMSLGPVTNIDLQPHTLEIRTLTAGPEEHMLRLGLTDGSCLQLQGAPGAMSILSSLGKAIAISTLGTPPALFPINIQLPPAEGS